LVGPDEEGDVISVTTVGDFEEALAAHRRSEATALRLTATATAQATTPSPAPAAAAMREDTPQPQPSSQPRAASANPRDHHEDGEDDDDTNSADEAERDMGPARYNERGQRVHPYVTCDGCQGAVAGVRYKCASCYDFDLCEGCEAKNAHPHHHVLLKIRVPQRVRVWAAHARPGGPGGPSAAPRCGRFSYGGAAAYGGCHPGQWGGGWWGARQFAGGQPYRAAGGCCASGSACGRAASASPSPSPAPAPAPSAAPEAASRTTPAPAAPPTSSAYDAQLRILHEMGFVDDEVNLRLLQGRRGRIEDVIARLTQMNMEGI
jgi:hypothetical protein